MQFTESVDIEETITAFEGLKALSKATSLSTASVATSAALLSACSSYKESGGESLISPPSVTAHFGLDLSSCNPKGGWSAQPMVLEATLEPKVQTYPSKQTHTPEQTYTPKRTSIPPPLIQEEVSISGGGDIWNLKKRGNSTVRMVNEEMGFAAHGNLGSNPLINKVLAQMALPKFWGKSEDWPAFKKLWRKYLGIIFLIAHGQDVPDGVLLEILKATLDAHTKKLLQKREELNPALTYQEFWAELENEFECDL